MSKSYWVYILASYTGVLYVGITNDLERRVWEHKQKEVKGFTAKYKADRLVWYDETDSVDEAIGTEKKIKKWRREKKVWLIEQMNKDWEDLAGDWY